MRKPVVIMMVFTMSLSSCNKDCDDIPEEPGWKKFEGHYNVTKLENGQTYQMEIGFDSLVHQPSGETHLYIIYRNFDDSFDSLANGYSSGIPSDRLEIQPFSIQHGVEDYNGSRWSLSMLADDPDTPELENTLVNDTILFYFQKSNIAFYFEDGVPFYECECKHLAVKIE
jgi:hypothetical protein